MLIQTKTDLIQEAEVNELEVEQLASNFGVPLFRVCSKDNIMVKEVFLHLAETYFGKQKHLEDDYAQPITSIMDLKKNKPKLGQLQKDKPSNGRKSITVG